MYTAGRAAWELGIMAGSWILGIGAYFWFKDDGERRSGGASGHW